MKAVSALGIDSFEWPALPGRVLATFKTFISVDLPQPLAPIRP
jgi:hypothetical protein